MGSEQGRWPGYLSKHNDVKADAIGFDERAVLSTIRVAVVLGKPVEKARFQCRGTGGLRQHLDPGKGCPG